MKELKIYTECEMPLDEALAFITEDWIDNGNCCDQTTFDLWQACKELRKENKKSKGNKLLELEIKNATLAKLLKTIYNNTHCECSDGLCINCIAKAGVTDE